MIDLVLFDGAQDVLCVNTPQANVGSPHHGDGPWETPAIAVKHGQGPQIDRKVGHVPSESLAS